jgi:hypothetical protein
MMLSVSCINDNSALVKPVPDPTEEPQDANAQINASAMIDGLMLMS